MPVRSIGEPETVRLPLRGYWSPSTFRYAVPANGPCGMVLSCLGMNDADLRSPHATDLQQEPCAAPELRQVLSVNANASVSNGTGKIPGPTWSGGPARTGKAP